MIKHEKTLQPNTSYQFEWLLRVLRNKYRLKSKGSSFGLSVKEEDEQMLCPFPLYGQVTFHALISCPVAPVPLLHPVPEVPVLVQPPRGHWATVSMAVTLIFQDSLPSFLLSWVMLGERQTPFQRMLSPLRTVVLLLTDVGWVFFF